MTYSCKFCGQSFLSKDMQERHLLIGKSLGCRRTESFMEEERKADNKKLASLQEGKRAMLSDGRMFEKKNGYIVPIETKI